MDSPILPDPYVALGVTKDADGDAIKKAYRKLALKLHPDKCNDESQKATRTDEFTKIQQAYDIVGNEERRRTYDAEVRLAELRRQNMEMRSGATHRPGPDAKYNVRTSAPREPSYSSSRAAPPPARPTYESHPSRSRYYENDYEPSRGSTRKASVADEYVYVKRPSPREEKREKVRVTVEPREEERRRDAKRREAEVRESRSSKYRDDYEEDRRRRDYEDMRRKTDVQDGHSSPAERILEEQLRDAKRHMDRQTRPSMVRRESSHQVPKHREPEVRRSAAPAKDRERTRESRRTSPSKDERRRMAETVDPYERRVPHLSSHTSAPPVVEPMPPPPPPRGYSTSKLDSGKKAKDVSPPPTLPRSNTETMPGAFSYPYDDDRAAPPVSYSNGHRTVLREPSSSARRSDPSPSRPSKGAVKMKGLDPKSVKRTQYSYAPGAGAVPIVEAIPKSSSSSSRPRASERDRDYSYERSSRPHYFGEHGAGTVDPRYSQPSSPYEDMSYSRQPAAADIRYTPPRMARHQTYVY